MAALLGGSPKWGHYR